MKFTKQYVQNEYKHLQEVLASQGFASIELMRLYETGWAKTYAHGDYKRWSSAFESLPEIKAALIYGDTIKVCGVTSESNVKKALESMLPWRKGPFEIFGVHVDTEWRSDLKWQRVVPHVSTLKSRKVLDIGCGSGYHLWRMLEGGADLVLGIDTSSLFSFHFSVIKRYQPDAKAFFIPASIDDMPQGMESFDTVFSMGILYHRKEPLSHLKRIKDLLVPGGEMVLETLVVDGDVNTCLMPTGRYAKMKNVWFIPSVEMLSLWMKRLGFKDVRCVDINQTSTDEQRVTDWMRFESLADYLDPYDSNKTVEGYPAPKRAVMIANT